MDQEFHNKISELCLKHFEKLPKTGKPHKKQWTVLSCIVLELNKAFEVVSLGTGSKCVGKNKMSDNGSILNDSHAEIMCRRSFLRYLLEEIAFSFEGKSSIFNFDKEEKYFLLSKHAKFHFFTTHVPCGDAAIFPKQNEESFGKIVVQEENENFGNTGEETYNSGSKRRLDGEEDVSNKRVKLCKDIFRTGAKCLEGNQQDPKLGGEEYHITGVVRTKPGRGDPTLSVSCSDKICRWCHLGIQGALVVQLTKSPIFLSSFTIVDNTAFNMEALDRALYGRLKEFSLESPFNKKPVIKIGQSVDKFEFSKDDKKQPCPSSISWRKTKETRPLEVAVEGKRQGVPKKSTNTKAGRLSICRMELFQKYLDMLEKIEIKIPNCPNYKEMTYKQAKMLSENYTIASRSFKQCMKSWVKKNEDLIEFCCD